MSIGFPIPLIVIKFKKEGEGINYELWTMKMSIKTSFTFVSEFYILNVE